MKANEFMLGDWVNWHTYTDRPHYCRITRVEEDRDGFGYNCEPIPLTPEILELNGWVRGSISTFKWYLGGRGAGQLCLALFDHHFNLTYYEQFGEEECECGPYIPEVAIPTENGLNVHTFQHALRLCGLNELADNFKIERNESE